MQFTNIRLQCKYKPVAASNFWSNFYFHLQWYSNQHKRCLRSLALLSFLGVKNTLWWKKQCPFVFCHPEFWLQELRLWCYIYFAEFLPWKYQQKLFKAVKCHLEVELALFASWQSDLLIVWIYCHITSSEFTYQLVSYCFTVNSRELKLLFSINYIVTHTFTRIQI